jgi:DNA invertase Pin-like site-specific DNA recombinase
MTELERSLIVEWVRAGMRNARSKGKHLGRPRRTLDARRIASMRAQGGWKKIARELGCGVRTVLRVGQAEEKRGSVMPAESGAGSALLSVRV